MNFHLNRIVDLVVFAVANAINLLLIVMFLARARRAQGVEKTTGLFIIAMGVPLAAAAAISAVGHRAWWTWGRTSASRAK